MSAAPSEPEKYSIDEMMDRLKNSSSDSPEGEGERVIRADGTEAIRVRKRKRRSDQPHKTERHRNRRSRVIQVSAALALVTLSGLGIGAAIVFANSPPFREGLLHKISQSTGGTAELTEFRMNPQSANAGELTLRWPEGNILKSLALRRLVAEIFPPSFLGKAMTGEEVTVTEGILNLQVPKPGQPLVMDSAPDGALPINFKRYRIPKVSATLGDPADPGMRLTNAEASLNPSALNGRAQLSLNQGELVVSGWPKLRLDRAFMEFRGNEIDVVGLRLQEETDNRGVFELSGTLLPYSPDRLSTLSVKLESFPLTGLMGVSLGRLFSGKIDTLDTTKSNYFSFFPRENPSPKLAIAFRSSLTSSIEVAGFPFLFGLFQTLDDEWFQHPVFDGENAGGTLHRESGVVSLKNLNLESKGRMALRGSVSMSADEMLSGNLEVGLTEAMIISSSRADKDLGTKSRLDTLFGPPKDGFRWLSVKVGGTAAAPTDNFKDLYLSPATSAPEKEGEPEHKGSTYEELTRPR